MCPILTPFLCNWTQNWQFFEVLPIFFRTAGLQLKLIELYIESPNIFHWKPAKNKVGLVFGQNLGKIRSMFEKKVKKLAISILIGFSIILHGEYILKEEAAVVQTAEWKFKANIARNAIFQGC